MNNHPDKVDLLGVGVTSQSEGEILEYIEDSLVRKSEKYYIVTPNPEILVYAAKHTSYKDILNQARIALPDGIGLVWAARLLGKQPLRRITGVDFIESLC